LSWPWAAGSRLLALLYPADCALCGAALSEFSRVPLCHGCLEPVEPFLPDYCCARCRTPFVNAHPLDEHGLCALCRLDLIEYEWSWSYGLHEGRLRELIHLYKYDGMRPLGRVLGGWMARAYPRQERFDALVPMPLHWWKYLRRGFNQSELLAREIGRRVGVPVWSLARRRKATAAQAGLTRAQRRANVRAAFTVPHPERVRGRSLLLIDDVQTTGATVNACARALKRAGAERVSVLTLARAGAQHDVRLIGSDQAVAGGAKGVRS
jgi:ComF family protein